MDPSVPSPLHLPFSSFRPPPPPPPLHITPNPTLSSSRRCRHHLLLRRPPISPPPSPSSSPSPHSPNQPSSPSPHYSPTRLPFLPPSFVAPSTPTTACCRNPSSAPPATGAADLLDGLRYPCTFQSSDRFQDGIDGNAFVRPLGDDPDTDFCFSLDAETCDLGSGFFYGDCPGVVSAAPEPDASSKTFSLPHILSVECANFAVPLRVEETLVAAPMLPSEYWALRLDLDSLDGCQPLYGYTVMRAASCVDLVQEEKLKCWVIYNSHRFGILIEFVMREHIFLLLRLCLKAIGREARAWLKLILNKNEKLKPKSNSSECPNFLKSFTWLASQLAILYGEVNGRLFALGMLKESLLQAGSTLLFDELGRQKMEESGVVDVANACLNNKGHDDDSQFTRDSEIKYPPHGISRHKVYISQVAAVVAALHERSWLEERIRALRFSQPVSKYQIILEHTYASARASTERQKCPNYRPILEHDGLIWHQDQNQDLGKAKTREELLAEERDYKRRRMTYRGKKMKRNPSQVLRDIIFEHTEEIKQAGGIGCNVKVTAENKNSHLNHSDPKSCSSAYDKPPHVDVSESDQSYVSQFDASSTKAEIWTL